MTNRIVYPYQLSHDLMVNYPVSRPSIQPWTLTDIYSESLNLSALIEAAAVQIRKSPTRQGKSGTYRYNIHIYKHVFIFDLEFRSALTLSVTSLASLPLATECLQGPLQHTCVTKVSFAAQPALIPICYHALL